MKFISDKMKENGTTELLVCPQCNEMVSMEIFRSSTGIGLLGMSFYDFKVEYITLCPNCGAMFSVDKDAVKHAEGKSKDISWICENKLTFIRSIK